MIVDPADLELDPVSEASLAGDTNARRNVEVLREYAIREPAGKRRAIRLRFAVSPVAIHGDGKVESIEVVRNDLVADDSGSIRAIATDERETIPCGIVFRSVGYLGVRLPGVPFDDSRATIPHREGRVVDEQGEQVAGVYCTGWIKRGPSGVIGTNKKDATETVELLLEDARAGRLAHGEPSPTFETVEELLASRDVEYVSYAGWEAIDAEEQARGTPQGRPRIKLSTWDELSAAARGATVRR